MEIFAKAPGQRTTVVHTLSGDSTTTYDGRDGWIAAPDVEKPMPVFPITGQELDGVKLEVELWFPSRIKQALDQVARRRAGRAWRSRGHGRSGHDRERRDGHAVLRLPNPGCWCG